MKGLIWFLMLFAAAVALVLAAQAYSGHVHLIVEQTQITVSLHFFVAVLAVFIALLYLLLRLLDGVLSVPARWRRFGRRRSERQAAEALNKAGLAYFEGRFQEAERAALKVLDKHRSGGQEGTLALMLAAHSADRAGDGNKLAGYLKSIGDLPAKSRLSGHLLAAESALARRDYEAAETALAAAAALAPKLTRLVRLQLALAFERNRAREVLSLADTLEKSAAIGTAEAAQYREWAYRELLAAAEDYDGIKAVLHRMPDELKQGVFAPLVAAKLLEIGQYPRVVKWVRRYYPDGRDSRLLPYMMEAARYLSEREQQKVMDTAEAWQDADAPNAELLFNLGKMAYTQKLWGKAQAYLEAALNAGAPMQARMLLAKVFDETDKPADAERQRKSVLAQMGGEDSV